MNEEPQAACTQLTLPLIVQRVEDLDEPLRFIHAAAEKTRQSLHFYTTSHAGVDVLRQMKFAQIGVHPISGKQLNVVEQINQTFSLLVALKATRILFETHPDIQGYRIGPCTSPGTDIVSIDGQVAAEVFAATSPHSNQKLKTDIARVAKVEARYRYVFFAAPGIEGGWKPQYAKDNVEVCAVYL